MEFEYKDWDWKAAGKVTLDSAVFAAPLRKDIIARVIRWQQSKARAGTHATKTVAMVSGGGKKPWAQKETGRARQGSIRSAQFRGGGVVFGPHPRSYEHKLNKKVKALGCVSSLTYKLQEGLFSVVKDFQVPFTKTAGFSTWLKDRQFKSVLFVLDGKANDEEVFRCVRNMPYCDVISVQGLNVLDIVKHKNIICDLASLKAIEERFANAGLKHANGKNPVAAQPVVASVSKASVAKKAESKVSDKSVAKATAAKKPAAKTVDKGAKK